jgi:hypothetical protein
MANGKPKKIGPKIGSQIKKIDIIDGFGRLHTFYDNGNFALQSTNTSKLFVMTMNMLKIAVNGRSGK